MVLVQFNVRPSEADNGKIIITVTHNFAVEPAASSDADYYIEIIDPDGDYVKEWDLDTPDFNIIADSDSETLEYDLPLDSDGEVVEGEYIIKVRKQDGDVYGDYIYTYDFAHNAITADLSVEYDCYIAKLIVRDLTSYTGYTSDRLVTIRHPVIPNVTPVADTTSTAATTTVDLTHEYVTYQVILETDIELETEVEVDVEGFEGEGTEDFVIQVLETVTQSVTTEIVCDLDACDLIGCIDSKLSAIYTKICQNGGFNNLSKGDQEFYTVINTLMAMYTFYRKCKNQTKALEYYNRIKQYLGDCDCDCSTSPKTLSGADNIVYLQGDDGLSAEVEFLDGTPAAWTTATFFKYAVQAEQLLFLNFKGSISTVVSDVARVVGSIPSGVVNAMPGSARQFIAFSSFASATRGIGFIASNGEVSVVFSSSGNPNVEFFAIIPLV